MPLFGFIVHKSLDITARYSPVARESTAVAGLDWALHYEFVTRAEVSAHAQSPAVTAVTAAAAAIIPTAEPEDCDKEFRSDMAGGGFMTMQVKMMIKIEDHEKNDHDDMVL